MRKDYSLGVDPGLDGAVAFLGPQGVIWVEDTPTLLVERPKSRRAKARTMRTYDVPAMATLLRRAMGQLSSDPTAQIPVVLEKVTPMPDQGVTSMFTFGVGLGIWRGIIGTLGLPMFHPAPQTWKKVVMRDGPKTKEAAVALAQQLYPAAAHYLRGARGGLKIDRAEAILMGHYAKWAAAGGTFSTPAELEDDAEG